MKNLIVKEILVLQKNVFMYVLTAMIMILFVVNGAYYSAKYSEFLSYNGRALSRHGTTAIYKNYYLPANPVIFCCDSNEKQMSTLCNVSPAKLNLSPNRDQRGNIFLESIHSMDWTRIVQIIFSLLMIVLGYSGISDENEKKTLNLVCSYSISRWKLFLGKFAGILLFTAVILLLALTIGLITILLAGKIPVDGKLLSKSILFYGVSLIYCSFFIFVSLGVSAKTRNSTMSLSVSVLIWVGIVLILPKTSVIAASHLQPARSEYENAKQFDRWEKPFEDEVTALLLKAQENKNLSADTKEQIIRNLEMNITQIENRRAEAEYRLNNFILLSEMTKYQEEQKWLKLSPAMLYRDTIETVVQGGNAYFLDFLKQMQFFEARFREDMFNRYNTYIARPRGAVVRLDGEDITIFPDWPHIESNHMEFKFKPRSFRESLVASALQISILVLLTMITAIWGFIGFVRQEITS